MHVRVSRVRRGGNTYEYAQLVESYRRDDGMPAHRVVHSFGRVSPTLLANLRAAFRAARNEQQLEPAAAVSVPQPPIRAAQAALRYLDVAVVLELFRQLGLNELLSPLLDEDGEEMAAHKVVASLVAQRCVAADSKLAATRWFPTTALPELLAVAPEQFNNTRVHRVLERLEAATPEVMRAVAEGCAQVTGGFATLYLDITDTWFEGKGPQLAAFGKTKEGMMRSKVGIILLCNEHGYPLRWEVLQGRYAEAPVMLALLRGLRDVSWLKGVPVVCDRIMGKTAHLEQLVSTGLQFITALSTTEMPTYFPSFEELAQPLLPLSVGSEQQIPVVAEQARCHMARHDKMSKVSDDLFVLDAGVVQTPQPPLSGTATASTATDAPGDAMRMVLEVTEAVANGRYAAYNDAFRQLGLDPQKVRNLRGLVSLPRDLQQRLLAGEAAGLPAHRFAKIAALRDEARQRQAFEAALCRGPRRVRPTGSSPPLSMSTDPLQLRVVVSFNPLTFASQRLTAHRHLTDIRQAVVELNAQLSSGRSRMTKKGIERRIDELLRRKDLLQAFHLEIRSVDTNGLQHLQVELTLDERDWNKRRRSDGFSVLVAHPDVTATAANVCRTYRAKDVVETDFRVIKSQVRLRPIHHRSDLKVRAHVTLCMLALLVERTLRQRLTKLRPTITAESTFELLEPVRLCHFPARNGNDTYLPTQLSDAQRKLLRALRLLRLVDPAEVAASVTPRPPVVTTKNPNPA